jgi:hypothetical protein
VGHPSPYKGEGKILAKPKVKLHKDTIPHPALWGIPLLIKEREKF